MTEEIDLYALVETVADEASFVAFVDALRRNYEASQRLEKDDPSAPYGPAALGWENITVAGFLEAAAAWARDCSPQMRAKQTNPWQRCAAILLAGKFYE